MISQLFLVERIERFPVCKLSYVLIFCCCYYSDSKLPKSNIYVKKGWLVLLLSFFRRKKKIIKCLCSEEMDHPRMKDHLDMRILRNIGNSRRKTFFRQCLGLQLQLSCVQVQLNQFGFNWKEENVVNTTLVSTPSLILLHQEVSQLIFQKVIERFSRLKSVTYLERVA